RYDVFYRLGGRAYPLLRAGTFKIEREAKARRDLVAGEIAHGRNPADLLGQLSRHRDTFVPFETWGERFVIARIDVTEGTRKMYESRLRRIGETFAGRDPRSITAAEVAEWVGEQAETLKPGTIGQRLDVFKLLLDFAEVVPNPARDRRVKMPKRVSEEVNPPSDEHFLAMLDAMMDRWRLFFVTIEQAGLRIGEAEALRWADVDAAGLRFRLPRAATKTNTSRWVQMPQWLMDTIEATCPLEDRVPDRRVFQGLLATTG